MTEDQIGSAMRKAATKEGHVAALPPGGPKPLRVSEAARARSMLLDGLGVEDIAVKLRVSPTRVRAYVCGLRADGTLASWWGPRK